MNDEKLLKYEIMEDLCKKIIKIIDEDKRLEDTGYECGIICNVCCFILGSVCLNSLKEEEYSDFFKHIMKVSMSFNKLILEELNER